MCSRRLFQVYLLVKQTPTKHENACSVKKVEAFDVLLCRNCDVQVHDQFFTTTNYLTKDDPCSVRPSKGRFHPTTLHDCSRLKLVMSEINMTPVSSRLLCYNMVIAFLLEADPCSALQPMKNASFELECSFRINVNYPERCHANRIVVLWHPTRARATHHELECPGLCLRPRLAVGPAWK